MTAIAGLIHFDGPPVEPAALERMCKVLKPYGPDAQNLWHEAEAGLLRTLCRITPEDGFDRQPLESRDGRWILVADGRIDNRAELARKLDIPPSQAGLLADSAFILAAFERWGESCLEHLLGGFAFALWERRAKLLFLARDPLGERPLYWYRGQGFFAFATLAKGLFALPEVPRVLCEERIADFLVSLPRKGDKSFYRNIYRLEPGHLLVLEGSRVCVRRYHCFDPKRRLRLKCDDDYVDAARELLDNAVECRLRSAGGVASHLSSGFDSSTITATAAQLLASHGRRLTAYTAVPRKGFDGPVPGKYHADEGPAAAALAARFANIDHLLIRPEAATPADRLREQVASSDHPPVHLCNRVWYDAIMADAARRGARVLLPAQTGNLTISYTGWPRMAALLRQGHLREWLTEARALRRCGATDWRRVLHQSLGPFLPAALWRGLNARRGRDWNGLYRQSVVHPDLIRRTELKRRVRQIGWDLNNRPVADGWRLRTALLSWGDRGNHNAGCVASYGIELRDPTADLRLVEFCLAIPEEQYFKNGRPRWLLHRLMQDVLPPEILELKTKGLQAADCYEGLGAARDLIGQWLNRLEVSVEAPGYLDLKWMRRALDNWPETGWDSPSVIHTYQRMLMKGLALGAFIHYVENGSR